MITDADPLFASDHKRDAYGFSVRPHHVQRYRQYVKIYKEEEEERSDRWNSFLEDHAQSDLSPVNGSSEINPSTESDNKYAEEKHLHSDKPGPDSTQGNVGEEDEKRVVRFQIWTAIRPSLRAIEDLMSVRVKKKDGNGDGDGDGEQEAPKLKSSKRVNGNDSEEEFYDVEKELELLVRGGAPMALRGELWQAFAGVKKRRV